MKQTNEKFQNETNKRKMPSSQVCVCVQIIEKEKNAFGFSEHINKIKIIQALDEKINCKSE